MRKRDINVNSKLNAGKCMGMFWNYTVIIRQMYSAFAQESFNIALFPVCQSRAFCLQSVLELNSGADRISLKQQRLLLPL